MSSPLTSGAAILATKDLPTEAVEVPEWGGHVLMRGLNGLERDTYEAEIITNQTDAAGKVSQIMNLKNARARLVARCVVDADGARLFSDADVEALGTKSASVLARLFEIAQRLSGLRQEDMKELVGESAPGQAAASPSASLGTSDT